MSEKKSLLVDKSKMPLAMGLAFVAFTTQFGGGFASGAQIYQYFINYGIWCLILPLVTQGLYALFFWYGMRYAYKHKTYDYRSFSDSMYGKTRHVMSNLYEICYLIMIGTASAAAFATGGSTLQTLFGIPYWVCTLIIAAFIFFIALYGTNVVRKCASTLSVLIIIGLVLVLVPNIIAQWGDISANISASMANPAPFGKALWIGFVYAAFQLASIGLLVQHAKPFASPDDAKTSMVQGFFVNVLICLMAVVGLMAIANDPNFATESIPLLILVNRGVAPGVLRPIISILIVLGSVSTAVNMIAGMSNRVCSSLDKNFDPTAKPGVKVIVVTLICTVVAFGIAQLGLNKIVAVGYKYLGYLTIPVIMIPYLVHMVATKFDTKD